MLNLQAATLIGVVFLRQKKKKKKERERLGEDSSTGEGGFYRIIILRRKISREKYLAKFLKATEKIFAKNFLGVPKKKT